MAARIKSPSNFKKLTNVAVVKLKRGGKWFEIACYPNKVVAWREGIETNLDEVLQQRTIFSNVSKGVLAKKVDVDRAFEGVASSEDEVLQYILSKGQLQVTEKERAYKADQMFRDIATIIAQRCIDKGSQKPLTVAFVESALKEIHFQPTASQSPKKQALEAIRLLSLSLPIERSKMKVRIALPLRDAKTHRTKLEPYLGLVEDVQSTAALLVIVAIIEPGHCRAISEYLEAETRGAGSLSLLSLAVDVDEDDQVSSLASPVL